MFRIIRTFTQQPRVRNINVHPLPMSNQINPISSHARTMTVFSGSTNKWNNGYQRKSYGTDQQSGIGFKNFNYKTYFSIAGISISILSMLGIGGLFYLSADTEPTHDIKQLILEELGPHGLQAKHLEKYFEDGRIKIKCMYIGAFVEALKTAIIKLGMKPKDALEMLSQFEDYQIQAIGDLHPTEIKGLTYYELQTLIAGKRYGLLAWHLRGTDIIKSDAASRTVIALMKRGKGHAESLRIVRGFNPEDIVFDYNALDAIAKGFSRENILQGESLEHLHNDCDRLDNWGEMLGIAVKLGNEKVIPLLYSYAKFANAYGYANAIIYLVKVAGMKAEDAITKVSQFYAMRTLTDNIADNRHIREEARTKMDIPAALLNDNHSWFTTTNHIKALEIEAANSVAIKEAIDKLATIGNDQDAVNCVAVGATVEEAKQMTPHQRHLYLSCDQITPTLALKFKASSKDEDNENRIELLGKLLRRDFPANECMEIINKLSDHEIKKLQLIDSSELMGHVIKYYQNYIPNKILAKESFIVTSSVGKQNDNKKAETNHLEQNRNGFRG